MRVREPSGCGSVTPDHVQTTNAKRRWVSRHTNGAGYATRRGSRRDLNIPGRRQIRNSFNRNIGSALLGSVLQTRERPSVETEFHLAVRKAVSHNPEAHIQVAFNVLTTFGQATARSNCLFRKCNRMTLRREIAKGSVVLRDNTFGPLVLLNLGC